METLLAARFKNFVMLACDQTVAHSIILVKSDENKFFKLSDKIVMAVCGEAGDTTQFSEYAAKNIQLYKIRHGYELSPTAAANFIRRNLAESLRSRSPYSVNLLLGGYEENKGPQLYYIDFLATKVSVPFASHGYGGMFCSSIFDKYYREDSTLEEAYDLFMTCVKEIQNRQIINLPNFQICYVDKNGVHMADRITPEVLRQRKAEAFA
ncbi:unnamed protein product [Cyprideis torosa]|uniref:Proteasome subunit beta n=1 Tax=Cyprideis torosa TaxID=163714 RepID=A0A7R8ZKI1_9CRUS|nr:unnamed protein product [Cyprideis torosa]CAG0881752.1 unnamed protein product [Cyprideis torosa]